MASTDPIGDDGRDCIKACVKVSIFDWRMVRMYTRTEALRRLRECFNGLESHNIEEVLPEKDKNGTPKDAFDIQDIRKALIDLDSKYPEEDKPDSQVSKRRRDIDKECRKFVSTCADEIDQGNPEVFSDRSKQLNEQMDDDEKGTIDANDAARQLSDNPDQGDSYVNNNLHDGEGIISSIDTEGYNFPENAVLPSVRSEGNVVSDGAKFSENYPEKEAGLDVNKRTETDHSTDGELDHGSGFIIDEHHAITCKHVVDDVLYDGTKEVRIANDIIGELPCEVVHSDASTDLALLHFRHPIDLTKVSPLKLAEHETKTGSAVFSFGYPISCTGKTALLAIGHVAGSVKRYGKEDLSVLICPVIHGHSGSPVISKVKGAPKVVGVISQRHKKDIVTPAEKLRIEKIRQSLSTGSITDASDNQTGLNLLVLKLYDALDTHCQFNYCNAVPGTLVEKFMLSYEQKCEKEEKARP